MHTFHMYIAVKSLYYAMHGCMQMHVVYTNPVSKWVQASLCAYLQDSQLLEHQRQLQRLPMQGWFGICYFLIHSVYIYIHMHACIYV